MLKHPAGASTFLNPPPLCHDLQDKVSLFSGMLCACLTSGGLGNGIIPHFKGILFSEMLVHVKGVAFQGVVIPFSGLRIVVIGSGGAASRHWAARILRLSKENDGLVTGGRQFNYVVRNAGRHTAFHY